MIVVYGSSLSATFLRGRKPCTIQFRCNTPRRGGLRTHPFFIFRRYIIPHNIRQAITSSVLARFSFIIDKKWQEINLKKFTHLFVFIYYIIATIFFTYPLTFQLKDSVVGGYGDNIYFVWLIHWYQRVILHGEGALFFNPWMNYPEGWNLSTTDTTLSSALPGVPFSELLGPVAGYNIAMLVTFVLSGFFMYLWVHHLTKSVAAALIAGTMFAFLPYRTAHFMAGHLNLSGTHWFPLFFLGLTQLLKIETKLNWKAIALTVFSITAIGFTSMYYLYMTVIFAAIFAFFYVVFTKFAALKQKIFYFQLALVGLISLPLVFLSLKPFIELSRSGIISSRSIDYVSMYSASPTDFLLPSSSHFIFGRLLSPHFDRSLWMESSLYIGITTIILAIIALVFIKRSNQKPFILSALIVSVVSIILGMGIHLHWNNQSVIWQIPVFLQPLFNKSETLIYLPSYWLFDRLPFFSSMRALMRFGLFALMFMPVMAAFGFIEIQKKFKGNVKSLFTIGIISLVLFEFYAGPYTQRLSQPHPRAVDLWLAEQSSSGAVVQMPFSESVDQAQIYFTIFHQKPIVGGFFNANKPHQYQAIEPILNSFPDQDSLNMLKELDVEYIVINRNAYDQFPEVEKYLISQELQQLTTLDGQSVFSFSR